jgi:hypothetical protein
MSTDEFPISTNNPGLAKLALWLLGLVSSLGVYIWQGQAEHLRRLEMAQGADHETIAELRRQVAVMAEHGTAVEAKVDRILVIVERRR